MFQDQNFEELTVIIVTYKTNKEILYECITSIDNKIKIIIVENGNDISLKNEIENKFKNIKVILSEKNLGYGGGNNLGCKHVKTRYVFISNPDTIYTEKFFLNVKNYIKLNINFNIIGASYPSHDEYLPYGGFSNKSTEIYKTKSYDTNDLKDVDWVVGCSMLIDLKNLKMNNLFDENIFFFYDETDLCRRIKNSGGIVLNSKRLIVNHLGQKSSIGSMKNKKLEAEKFRNWHLMWSEFYYHKKHNSFIFAFHKVFGKLIRSLFKMIFFLITNNKEKKIIYQYRFFGLINSILGKKSWYRIEK